MLEKNSTCHIISKPPNAQNNKGILKAVMEKGPVPYKDRPFRIIPDFSAETLKVRRPWIDVIQTLREPKCQARALYPIKLSITIYGESKIFNDKTKFK